MRNIKAMSGVIENVLLILLVISAIAVTYFYVNKAINETAYSPALSCAELLLKDAIKIEDVCYDGNDIKLILRKNEDININSLKFAVMTNSGTKIYSCADCGNCEILQEGIKTYYFNANGEKISLIVNDCLIEEKNIIQC